jgi:hypothetical protein
MGSIDVIAWAVIHVTHASALYLFLQSSSRLKPYDPSKHEVLLNNIWKFSTYLTENKKFWEEPIAYVPWYDTARIENDVSNNFSIVACVFVTAVTFLSIRCLATKGGFLPNRVVT